MSQQRTKSTRNDTELLSQLERRFLAHPHRHQGMDWASVAERIHAHPTALASLHAMEDTGGEPDVIGLDEASGAYLFVDCSPETPAGRRSLCYDPDAQRQREKKGVYPAGNVIDMAQKMGIALLDEAQYRRLQAIEPFDTRTESWLLTPSEIRQLGGAIFGDRRYGRVFVFHNSAPSFYASRGFRGLLSV